MGLDMYLSVKKHISAVNWNATSSSEKYVYFPEYKKAVKGAGLSNFIPKGDIYGIEVSATCAYWRKANAIHNWFVKNVQDGEDDCGSYYVPLEKLITLRNLAQVVIETKNPEPLLPSPGFFFGSTETDEWYYRDMKNTVKQLDRVIKAVDSDPSVSFYYQSSW